MCFRWHHHQMKDLVGPHQFRLLPWPWPAVGCHQRHTTMLWAVIVLLSLLPPTRTTTKLFVGTLSSSLLRGHVEHTAVITWPCCRDPFVPGYCVCMHASVYVRTSHSRYVMRSVREYFDTLAVAGARRVSQHLINANRLCSIVFCQLPTLHELESAQKVLVTVQEGLRKFNGMLRQVRGVRTLLHVVCAVADRRTVCLSESVGLYGWIGII